MTFGKRYLLIGCLSRFARKIIFTHLHYQSIGPGRVEIILTKKFSALKYFSFILLATSLIFYSLVCPMSYTALLISVADVINIPFWELKHYIGFQNAFVY